jgi:hypothetical protein
VFLAPQPASAAERVVLSSCTRAREETGRREITRDHGRLLRQVLADISGYQRGELTASMRELRRILSEA